MIFLSSLTNNNFKIMNIKNLKIESVGYDPKVWHTHKNTFYILDEDYCIKNNLNLEVFLNEDLLKFKNLDKGYIIDIGVYGEKLFKLPFVGYTIYVIKITNHDATDWDNPIDKIIIKSSNELNKATEHLLEKYS